MFANEEVPLAAQTASDLLDPADRCVDQIQSAGPGPEEIAELGSTDRA